MSWFLRLAVIIINCFRRDELPLETEALLNIFVKTAAMNCRIPHHDFPYFTFDHAT